MPKITFIYADGGEDSFDVPNGISILEAAHKHSLPLEGACEGSLACATCHVVVDPAWFSKLPTAKEEEEDMLDLAFGLTHTSRLGCQIILSDELSGIRITLPNATRNINVGKK
jgi:2Fe-2S ferredoxin